MLNHLNNQHFKLGNLVKDCRLEWNLSENWANIKMSTKSETISIGIHVIYIRNKPLLDLQLYDIILASHITRKGLEIEQFDL